MSKNRHLLNLPAFLFFLLVLATLLALLDGSLLARKAYHISYLDQKSSSLGGTSDISVLFVSDLCYDETTDQKELDRLLEQIQSLDTDLVLFGGDLFGARYSPISDDVLSLTAFFEAIDAPLGKFAVFGDYDLESDAHRILVEKILKDGGFEHLAGSRTIFNSQGQAAFELSGYDYDASSVSVSTNDCYQLALVHGIGLVQNLNSSADLILSGHSHQWIINYPFKKHDSRLHQDGRLYRVSSLAASHSTFRLLNHPELLLVHFIPD